MNNPNKKRWLAALGILSIGILVIPPTSRAADEVYTFVVKKQEEKAKSRWSLQEWLDTRDRMRMMDLWLALHSPSPYEFYVGGDVQWGTPNGQPQYSMWRMNAGAYASIFGLEYQHSFSPYEENLGIFHLRIFGFHAQSTNITLEAGVRVMNQPEVVRNGFAGVGMSIYILKYFGIDTLFRHYFHSAPTASGIQVNGNRFEGGAFIDLSFFRVYGSYFTEADNFLNRSGALLGTRIFF